MCRAFPLWTIPLRSIILKVSSKLHYEQFHYQRDALIVESIKNVKYKPRYKKTKSKICNSMGSAIEKTLKSIANSLQILPYFFIMILANSRQHFIWLSLIQVFINSYKNFLKLFGNSSTLFLVKKNSWTNVQQFLFHYSL